MQNLPTNDKVFHEPSGSICTFINLAHAEYHGTSKMRHLFSLSGDHENFHFHVRSAPKLLKKNCLVQNLRIKTTFQQIESTENTFFEMAIGHLSVLFWLKTQSSWQATQRRNSGVLHIPIDLVPRMAIPALGFFLLVWDLLLLAETNALYKQVPEEKLVVYVVYASWCVPSQKILNLGFQTLRHQTNTPRKSLVKTSLVKKVELSVS